MGGAGLQDSVAAVLEGQQGEDRRGYQGNDSQSSDADGPEAYVSSSESCILERASVATKALDMANKRDLLGARGELPEAPGGLQVQE